MDAVKQESMEGSKETYSLLLRVRTLLASFYSYFSFSFVRPLIDKAHKDELNEHSATEISFDHPSIKDLADKFEAIYRRLKVFYGPEKAQKKNLVIRTIAIQYLPHFLSRILWVTLQSTIRLIAPLFLRQFLIWIEDYNDDKAEYYGGWMWGLLLVSCVFGFMLVHHRYVWQGALIGYRVKYSLISLVHAKLLRLNSSMIAELTTGHIVNLISNDVKRFEMTFVLWLYVIVGPLETIVVLFMVSSVLGFLPAIGALGCMLLMIPLQAFFAGYISKFREQTAVITDKRVSSMEELITGSLAVKMLVWEDPLMDKVNTMRDAEDKLLKKTNYIKANSMALYSYIQIVMMCVIMILLRSTGEEFNVPDVFFAISLLALPRLTMTLFFAAAVQQISELLVSTRRLDDFFKTPEPKALNHDRDQSSARGNVSIVSGCYGWYNDDKSSKKIKQKQSRRQNLAKREISTNEESYKKARMTQTLSDIEFHAEAGELIGIVGKVGSGKSSILTALLNDMEIMNQKSSVQISGTIAYSAQVPFIIAATLRENIVFGQPFDESLYSNVLSSCALDVDIEQLPLGDATVIGERGINLSGGQKARVALARAAYSKADINLLDDPLSAVDARVGRTLFENCIGGDNAIMIHSTRLFVTHQKQFLAFCDRIILMNDGRIECIGRWDQLENHPLLKVEKQMESEQHLSLNASNDAQKKSHESKNTHSVATTVNEKEEGAPDKVDTPSENDNSKQMVKAEGKEHGKIDKKVYWNYFHHIGVLPMLLSLAMLVLSKMLYFIAEWWVARWASAETDDQDNQEWTWVLIGLTIAVALTATFAVFSIFHLLVHGSTQLHNAMVKCVLHAPLRFFHTNPTGRILNRFSKDLGMQDDELPVLTGDVLIVATQLIGTLVLILIALPYALPLIILIAYLFRKVQNRYIVPSREIKRYDSLTRSPVYAMFSLNMKGVSTIRAFGREKDFHKSLLNSLDLNSSWWLSSLATSRWFGFRLDGISGCVTFSSIVVAILASKIVSEEILALALTNALGLSGTLQWCMRQMAELENAMTAVERNLEYSRLEQEPSEVKEGGGEAPDNWPAAGCIEFKSVTASYRPGLDPVLQDISFKVPGGSSVGIVGRTGSGKSSLLLTLFRLIDINDGSIYIDDVNTSTIGIDVLRKQIAVIPQDPVLFGGTFRTNLDPWKEFSDIRLWGVLQEVHLDSAVNAFGGLDAPISESGNNLSVGQRQLLCLARALLGESKILALDEATANVDHVTDAQIQASLRAVISQKEKTLLIIAHRINTISDCDLLLVLENGKKVEFGSPEELLAKQEGRFKGMVEAVKRASNVCLD